MQAAAAEHDSIKLRRSMKKHLPQQMRQGSAAHRPCQTGFVPKTKVVFPHNVTCPTPDSPALPSSTTPENTAAATTVAAPRTSPDWPREAAGGLVAGLVAVVYALSYAALLFAGPLRALLPVGIGLCLVNAMLGAFWLAWRPFRRGWMRSTRPCVSSPRNYHRM